MKAARRPDAENWPVVCAFAEARRGLSGACISSSIEGFVGVVLAVSVGALVGGAVGVLLDPVFFLSVKGVAPAETSAPEPLPSEEARGPGATSESATAQAAGDEPTDFLRLLESPGGRGRLETAIVTYKGQPPALHEGNERGREAGKAAEAIEVDLVAAVHIGDRHYYDELQKRFEGYDSLLYEMIKPAGVEPVPEARSDNLLSMFQRWLKDILNLEFQLDAIDYRRKNFVHADLDPETFFRLQREKGENLLSLLFRLLRREMELEATGERPRQVGLLELIAAFTSEDSSGSLKMLLARQMESMELLMAGLDDERGPEDGKGRRDGEGGKDGDTRKSEKRPSGSVILSERNKVVIRVLRKAIAGGSRKIGIFYGAGHMPDLERRLVEELGLKKDRTAWITAWDMGVRDSGEQDPDAKEGGGGDSSAGERGQTDRGMRGGKKEKERERTF